MQPAGRWIITQTFRAAERREHFRFVRKPRAGGIRFRQIEKRLTRRALLLEQSRQSVLGLLPLQAAGKNCHFSGAFAGSASSRGRISTCFVAGSRRPRNSLPVFLLRKRRVFAAESSSRISLFGSRRIIVLAASMPSIRLEPSM